MTDSFWETAGRSISTFFETVWLVIKQIGVNDIIDIAIVAFLIYKAIVFIRDSRVQLLVKGIIVIAAAYAVSELLRLQMMSSIVELIIRNAPIALLVIFQPELRGVLERMGRTRPSVSSIFTKEDHSKERSDTLATVSAVVESFRVLQLKKMGALVVFEREVLLSDIIKTGTVVEAKPSAALLSNIFFNKAALHDGAVVIRNNKVYAAGCILPLTQNTKLGVSVGTRHRAAIGMSENSDAVSVVLSEETGLLSIAVDGELKRFATPAELSDELMRILIPEDKPDEQKFSFRGSFAKLFGKKEAESDE